MLDTGLVDRHRTQQKEGADDADDGPGTEDEITVKYAPLPNQVRVAEKLERGSQFEQAEDDFELLHPVPGLGFELGHQVGKQTEQKKRERKNGCKHQHSQKRPEPLSFRRRNHQRSHKLDGAGEGGQGEREPHRDHSERAAYFSGQMVRSISQRTRQLKLEKTHQAEGKDREQQTDGHVDPAVRCQLNRTGSAQRR